MVDKVSKYLSEDLRCMKMAFVISDASPPPLLTKKSGSRDRHALIPVEHVGLTQGCKMGSSSGLGIRFTASCDLIKNFLNFLPSASLGHSLYFLPLEPPPTSYPLIYKNTIWVCAILAAPTNSITEQKLHAVWLVILCSHGTSLVYLAGPSSTALASEHLF